MESKSLLNDLTTKHGKGGMVASPTNNERVPPHDTETEMAVLGAIMLNDSLIDDVAEVLTWTDFYRQSHELIFKAMVTMRSRGIPIDTVTVRQQLTEDGALAMVGGPIQLLEIVQSVTTTSNIKAHANIVRTKSKLRQLINIGYTLATLGFDPDASENLDEFIGEAVSLTTALAMAHQTAAIDVGEALDRLMADVRLGSKTYITPPGVGFARMKPGDLVVVAGGTSVGKTAISLEWAIEWSRYHHITYFEYEMDEADLMARVISTHAGVRMSDIQDGNITDEEMRRMDDASDNLKTRHFKLEEVWCDIGTLMAKIRREASQGCEIVILDHMGLIPFRRMKGQNEAKAIGIHVTNPLKRLASELGIIIVLLVQLNREGQRGEHFPKMYHLRDSGEIEQDASIVLMLWSEKAIAEDAAGRRRIRENCNIVREDEMNDDSFFVIRVGVEKNRNGRLGEKYLLFYGEKFTYEDRGEMVAPTQVFQPRLEGTEDSDG